MELVPTGDWKSIRNLGPPEPFFYVSPYGTLSREFLCDKMFDNILSRGFSVSPPTPLKMFSGLSISVMPNWSTGRTLRREDSAWKWYPGGLEVHPEPRAPVALFFCFGQVPTSSWPPSPEIRTAYAKFTDFMSSCIGFLRMRTV